MTYRLSFAANTVGTAPGSEKIEVHYRVTKREEMDIEITDIDIRRWKRTTKSTSTARYSQGEDRVMKAHDSLIGFADSISSWVSHFGPTGTRSRELGRAHRRAAKAYISHVENTGTFTNGGIRQENSHRRKS